MGFFDDDSNIRPPDSHCMSEDEYKDIINNAYLRLRGIEDVKLSNTLLELIAMVYFSYKSFIEVSGKESLKDKYSSFMVLCYFLEEFSRHFDYLTYDNK